MEVKPSRERIWLRHQRPDEAKVGFVQRFAVGRRLLDVGCAQGWYGLEAHRLGMEVTWSDLTRDTVPEVPDAFVQADVTALPFADDSFDTTLALDVIEHVADEEVALGELARVTRRRLIVSVPNADDELLQSYNLTYKHHIDRTHRRAYAADELVEKLARVGFNHFVVSRFGAVQPGLSAEFVPSAGARRVARWLLRKAWHAGLLRSPVYADILVVADKTVPEGTAPGGKRLRWTLLTPHFWPEVGGVQEYLLRLVQVVEPHRLSVIAPAVARMSGPDLPGVRVRRVPRVKRLRLLLTAAITAPAMLHRPSGVLVGMSGPLGLIALAWKRLFGIPYLVFCYGSELLRDSRWRRFTGRVLARADRVIAISGFSAGLAVRAGAMGVPISILRPAVRQLPAAESRGGARDSGVPLVLTVGRLEKRKGHAVVLRAIALLRAGGRKVSYALVGDGPERPRLERLAAKLGILDSVTFAGRVGERELADWYERADVFVMVSRSDERDVEGFGIVYLEASAAGKPVVAAAGGGVGDAVADGVTGLIVDQCDEESVAAALETLLADRRRAAEMGAAGRQWVAERFGAESFAVAARSILEGPVSAR